MSALSDVTVSDRESPATLALRLCSYMADDEKVQAHVKRLTDVDLSLRRISIIRQGLPKGVGQRCRSGYEPSDLPLRINAARAANDAFNSAILKAAGNKRGRK